MPALVNTPEALDLARLTHGMFDDFNHYTTTEEWTTVASDSGSITAGDAAGGVITLAPSDGSVANNDETYAKGTKEKYKFAANKPLVWEALVQFTEGNTDDVNIIVGLKDAVAADTLVDDGGGPPSSYSGCVFFKVDGGTKWQVETSVSTTQQTSTTDVTAGGAAYQRLRCEVIPIDSTIAEATYFIDGVQCKDANGNLIKHRFTYTGATEMQECLGIKNGADTTAEALLCDYFGAWQKR